MSRTEAQTCVWPGTVKQTASKARTRTPASVSPSSVPGTETSSFLALEEKALNFSYTSSDELGSFHAEDVINILYLLLLRLLLLCVMMSFATILCR